MYMRRALLGAASAALALASPAVAADLPVTPYSQAPSYQGEIPYEYPTTPPVVVEEPAPAVVIRRPLIVAPPVVVEEYPIYTAPRVYAAPSMYAYAGPAWRPGWGWGHRGHFRGGW